MKKKTLWLIVLSVVMCLSLALAACGKGNDYESTTALQIANKAELQADWFEGDDDRTVQLSLPAELTESDVYVTSSNPAAVLVEGKTLKAAGVGIAKITVASDDESDSVNITVKHSLKEITVTNKHELQKIVVNEKRTVEFSVKPDAFDVSNANVEIASSNTGVISVNGKELTAVSVGTSTLTVKIGSFSDTVEIEVINLSVPAFGIEDGAIVSGVTNNKIQLPTPTTCDGLDLSDGVVATCDSEITFDKESMTVIAAQKGDYSVKLEVSDNRNAEMKATVNLIVKVYRNIFADVNGYGNIGYESYAEGKKFVADNEQVTSFDRWDATFASFDMTPSKVYYAEATFVSEGKADWSTFYGMTHSVKGDNTRWLGAYIDRGEDENRAPEYEGEEQRYWNGARNFRIKDFDIENDNDCWQLNENNNPKTQIYYTNGLWKTRKLPGLYGDAFPFTFAVARINNFFYYFVDGEYICSVTNSYYADKDTVAGIFQQSGIQTNITNIKWCTGDDALTEFNRVSNNGSKIISSYNPWEGDWYHSTAENFTINPYTEQNGVSFTFKRDDLTSQNDTMVSPYIYFDGSFTFEWEYEVANDCAALNDGGWDRIMRLEVRNAKYADAPSILFGANYLKNDNGTACIYRRAHDEWNGENPTPVGTVNDWFNGKIKFSVTRICTVDENGKPLAKYTLTATSADGTHVAKWTYDDKGADKWSSPCEPVLLHWKNIGVKGTYTNIKYSIPENGVTIGNKTALAQKWTVGEENRTVVADITGSLKGPAIVTSSNPEVVSVNGNTLTAVGRGTTTITVAIGEYKDTVEITVTPKLDSVTITNKTELTAEWLDTATDGREISIAFDPADTYNSSNTDVKITSSDASVVKVDGNTLKVVGAGTATITVKVGDKTMDSAEITVKSTKTTLALKDNVTDIYGVAGEQIALPEIKALSADGNDISSQVTVTCSDNKVSITDTTYATVSETGSYTLTYTLAGADDVTLMVHVQRKVFAATAGQNSDITVTYETGAEYMEEGKEVAYLNGNGIKFAQMNVAAGKVYYAEVTFKADDAGNANMIYGLTHSQKGDSINRYLAAWVDRGEKYESAGHVKNDRMLKVKDFDMTDTDWKNLDPSTSTNPIYYSLNDIKLRTSDNGDAFPLTVGVMRNGDFFYVFINGEYVMGYTNKNLADKDTVPGIIELSGVKTGITGVTYLSGEEAVTKFNTLTANNKMIKSYRPFQENNGWNYGSAIDESWIETSTDASKGLNYTVKTDAKTGDNDAMISPYIVLDGDFTFEWEYTVASDSTSRGDWSAKMILELRGVKYADTDLQYGIVRIDNSNGDVCGFGKGDKTGNDWLTASGAKLKFKLVRSGTTYTFTITDANGENEVKWVSEGHQDPVIPSFKNKGIKGEYTNIRWSATAETN